MNSRSLTRYERRLTARRNPPRSQLGSLLPVLVVLVIGIVAYFIWKNYKKSPVGIGSYKNEESWDVSYNEDGMPTKIVVHRNAVRT